MKKIIIVLITLFATHVFAQNVGINSSGSAPDASAMLDINSTTKGVLVPRVALTDITVAAPITSPLTSLLVYNTTTSALATTSNNVIPGFYYWDGSKWVSISGGSGGKDWALLGNAGTTDYTNFIGTTDNKPLTIKVNSKNAGRIDHLLSNTFLGFQNNTTVPTGSFNSAIGALALSSLTSGTANVSSGYQALSSLTSGSNNVAVGYQALKSNTANNNSAFGHQALLVNNTGTSNSSFGHSSLIANTIGTSNCAFGYQSLFSNVINSNNTGIGMQAIRNSTGSGNTALGSGAGLTVTTGSNNTFVGCNADIATASHTNVTSIGFGAITYTSNTMSLGNGTVVAVYSAGNSIIRSPTLVAINATGTANASDIVSGYITSTSAAATSITLPTLANLTTQIGGTPARGSSLYFTIDNSLGANIITILVNTGITTSPSPVITNGNNLNVAASEIGLFHLIYTSGTAAKLYRVH